MCTLVPGDPFAIADIFLLKRSHFGNEVVVKRPIVFGAEEFGNDDNLVDIVMLLSLSLSWVFLSDLN